MKRQSIGMVSALLLTLALAALCLAQDAPKPQLSRVSVTQVKPEMWEQFLAFYKNETLPALKKAGVKRSLVLQASGPIGQSFELRVVQPVDSLAQFDEGSSVAKALGPEKYKAYQAKRRTMITGGNAYVIRSIPELSLPLTGTEKLLVRREVSVAAGYRADFESYQKDLLPLLKKAGLRGCRVSRLMLGGDSYAYSTVDSYDSFAEYEKVTEALNKDESYRQLIASGRTKGVILHSTRSVYSIMPELSILPAPAATASK
ncbi:MAG: hypothetical protein HYR56_08280 [Acidobacteria bacterium]|nr:hypothetical protein [Acidobacteriota bacterium]MBI3428382.1 hypothetical protein [Acidobacteriota bacterium]